MELRTLSDAELATLGVDGVWDHMADLQRFVNRVDAYRAHVLVVAESMGASARAGQRRMSAALAAQSGVSRGEARRRMMAAHTTRQHPELRGVFERGDITESQALAIGRAKVTDEVRQQLLDDAIGQTSDQTDAAVAAAERAGVDPNDEFTRQRELRSGRRFRDRDGMWNFEVRLDPEAGARADAVLCTYEQQLWRQDKETSRTPERTPWQRLADAFIAIVDDAASGGGRSASRAGPAVTLNVTIPHTWLAEQTDARGITNNGASLNAETLRRLACDAQILPTVLGGAREVLDVGRGRRTATDPQRRGLEASFGGCFNCGAPPSRCQVHHIDHWAADHGDTDIERMVLACRDCHILTHEGGYKVVQNPDGRWRLHHPGHDDRPEPEQPPDLRRT